MPNLDWRVGQKLSANRLRRRLPITAIKPANESITNDATLSDDAFLVLPLKANTVYDIMGLLNVTSAANAAGDFQYEWGWTGGSATIVRGAVGVSDALASGSTGNAQWSVGAPDGSSPAGLVAYGASTTVTGVRINDHCIVGSADITLTVRWSQLASNANATTLQAGSFVTAYPVG